MAKKPNKELKIVGQTAPPSDEGGILETLNDYLPPPPLIEGDDPADYEAFQEKCLAAIRPKDAIEHIWLRDFIDYSWESLRFRRMKADLINSSRKEAVERLYFGCGEGNYSDKPMARNMARGLSASEEDFVNEVEELFEDHGIGPETILAEAVSARINDLERIEKLITTYVRRRDNAIRELEKRRAALAKRAREFTDAGFTDVDTDEMIAAE